MNKLLVINDLSLKNKDEINSTLKKLIDEYRFEVPVFILCGDIVDNSVPTNTKKKIYKGISDFINSHCYTSIIIVAKNIEEYKTMNECIETYHYIFEDQTIVNIFGYKFLICNLFNMVYDIPTKDYDLSVSRSNKTSLECGEIKGQLLDNIHFELPSFSNKKYVIYEFNTNDNTYIQTIREVF